MRKQQEYKEAPLDSVLPEYGRKKLLMYADSFRDLASTFTDIQKKEAAEEENAEEEVICDRQEYLWKRRLLENRDLMADHLKEVAQIMTQVAQETWKTLYIGERRMKQITHALREEDIFLKDLQLLEMEDGHREVSLIMRAARGTGPAVEEVGNLLSVLMNLRLITAKSSPVFVGKEWDSYRFPEEPRFHVLTGVAKAVKETETISGDNYSFMEIDDGTFTSVLSDGMGSGDKACRDSELVVELTEKFLEAGFSKETAVQMINGSLIAGGEAKNMSTLDLCRISLYTGGCEFIKIGSAPSYIKRGHLVDPISARNLPLGVFYEIDAETVQRTLLDGDYVILLSDGILDALAQGIGEDILPEIIGKTELTNPGEIANYILNFCIHQSRGRIRDDMTVMVTGIWENLM